MQWVVVGDFGGGSLLRRCLVCTICESYLSWHVLISDVLPFRTTWDTTPTQPCALHSTSADSLVGGGVAVAASEPASEHWLGQTEKRNNNISKVHKRVLYYLFTHSKHRERGRGKPENKVSQRALHYTSQNRSLASRTRCGSECVIKFARKFMVMSLQVKFNRAASGDEIEFPLVLVFVIDED